MNWKTDIRRFDEKMHHLEHNMVLSGGKIMHSEAFWLIVAVAGAVAFFTLITMMGLKSAPPRNIFPTPFGPIY